MRCVRSGCERERFCLRRGAIFSAETNPSADAIGVPSDSSLGHSIVPTGEQFRSKLTVAPSKRSFRSIACERFLRPKNECT